MTDNEDDRRSHPTIPAPGPDDLAGQMAELQLAIAFAGDALDKLSQLLRSVRISQLTSEHRANVQRAKLIAGGRWFTDHERRIRRLEGLDTAAE